MRYHELAEAPLNDLELHGDLDNEGSFRASDMRAIKSPVWQLKAKNAFAKTPFVFNVYLYNGENGIVDFSTEDGYEHKLNTRELKHLSDKVGHGLIPETLISKLIGRPYNGKGFITAILFDNEGSNRLGLTPWILAHRISHAIEEGDYAIEFVKRVRSLMAELNDGADFSRSERNSYIYWMPIVGTMRSARNGDLATSPGEFAVELMTQYLIQGQITLNAPKPSDFGNRNTAAQATIIDDIRYHSKKLNAAAKEMFGMCVGKAFGI